MKIEDQIKQMLQSLYADWGPALSDGEVIDLETQVGLAFPTEYRQFLHVFGNITAGDGIFGSAGSDGQPSVAAETNFLRHTYGDEFPNNILAICPDGGGNYWCLVCEGPDVGKIIFWKHDVVPGKKYPYKTVEHPDLWIRGSGFWSWLLDFVADEKAALEK